MRECRHFVPEVGREISVFVNEGDLDDYRVQFASAFPVPIQLSYLLGQPAPSSFVDIGANIGGVAFFAAALGSKVLAIEALAENFLFLATGILANGFGEVLPCHAAATDRASVLGFLGSGAWGHVPQTRGVDGTTPVPGLSTDDLLKLYGFTEPDVIKIDVEGHELDVVRGLERTLSRARPVLIIESNTWTRPEFGSYEEPLELIRGHDYALFMYIDHEVRDDEDFRIQEVCVADYFCVPREKLGRVPMPSRRSLDVEERIALMARDLVAPSAHWWHAAHMIERFQQRFPATDSLEALKARIASEPQAVSLILGHTTKPPAWLAERVALASD